MKKHDVVDAAGLKSTIKQTVETSGLVDYYSITSLIAHIVVIKSTLGHMKIRKFPHAAYCRV